VAEDREDPQVVNPGGEDGMNVVGIDIGAARHVAAICRAREREAERAVLRISSRRAGFDQLDGWMARQGEVDLVVMESSGHYWMPLASHLRRRGVPVAVVNPLSAKYFAKSRLLALDHLAAHLMPEVPQSLMTVPTAAR
jgi:transposase